MGVFGRNEIIEEIVGLAENLTPIALIGAAGIGKTSIALAVLQHDRIKERFRDNRRFIRCDAFPTTRTHFLNRLSKVIGAGVKDPEDLAPLQPFLSSSEMIIVLDNAESILDPQGTNTQEIYAMVEELSEFDNICLCVTSRISAIPPVCVTFSVPTLSMKAADDTFYGIYKNSDQSDLVNDILEQLDFHPLPITLLATVAQHNKWNTDQLAREWETQRTNVLQSQHNKSGLATTIELSLASSTFQELGLDARGLLGVVAFFPQGINENNLDWLFPAIPDRTNIFDNFCILSLTHRSDGFITMLAPLRNYLSPKDPASSPHLNAIKSRYFSRLSVAVDPGNPGFEEAKWITSEDVNIEHLLDVFTSVDANSVDVWDTCAHFMQHLYWHKRRLVALGPKIERLPDSHPSKPECLLQISRLVSSVGNHVDYKRLLNHALELQKERGDDLQIAETLRLLSSANRSLGLHKEGVQQANEALEIYKQLNHTIGQAKAWQWLARLSFDDNQLNAAKEAALRSLDLLSDEAEQFSACDCYRTLANICHSRGETEDAITHLETALGIASRSNWHDQLFWIHYSLADLFFGGNKFDEAHVHIELAKPHATSDPYRLGRAMELQAWFWYHQRRFEVAKSEALHAANYFEKLGVGTKDAKRCRTLLLFIEVAICACEPAASR